MSAEFQFSKITCITYGCTKTHARARTRHIHSHNRTHTYAHAPRHTQTHTEPQIAHLHRYLHVRADLHSVCVRHHDAHHARDGTRSGVVVGEYMDEDYMHIGLRLRLWLMICWCFVSDILETEVAHAMTKICYTYNKLKEGLFSGHASKKRKIQHNHGGRQQICLT